MAKRAQRISLTARGAVRRFGWSSAVSVKLMKADLAAELREYLTVLDSGHQRDARRLKIQANGTGERPLLVSYTAEAPIWKTTYRLVLDASHKPLLQGWAIVDNTTANEWNDVQLSLVAGMPVSFIQNLSQPLYGRRPVVPMGQGFAVTPQVHQATLETPTGQGVAGTVFDPTQALVPNATVSVLDASGQVLKQVRSGTDGSFNVNLEIGTYRLKVERPGFRTFTANNLVVNPGRLTAFNPTLNVGVVSESVDVMASAERVNTSVARLAPGVRPASAPPSPPPTMSEIMRESAPETAQAQPVGDQFEYKLRQPVTIHRSQSALLPIVNAEIDGEKVVLYSESTGDRRPRFAVWLKNSSGLTLDAGSFSVIDTDAFAGEGLTETIHPGERRLLSYALDSGLEISSNRENERSRVERVAIAHGVMTLTRQVRDKKVYVIRNNDDKPRTLVVEHPVRAGWKLAETQEPAESSTAYYRFRVDARPKATTEFVVREVSQSPATYAISNVDSDTVAVWIKENTIDAEMEKSLREILRLRAIVADLRNKDSQLEAEDEKINESQTRLRDNLGKLNSGNKDEASLRLRYVKQMEQQEDRLAQIKTEQEKLEPQIEGAQKKLDDYIESIAFDKKL